MRRMKLTGCAATLALVLAAGCDTESKVKTEKTVETPDGRTKITTEQKVEKSGDHAPSSRP